jgi:D-alanine-D-alanine ligase
MLTVGVFYGGRSGEHDVSRCSAASVFENLDRSKYNVVAVGIDKDGRFYPDVQAEVSEDESFGRVLTINKTGDWYFNAYPDNSKLTFVEKQSGDSLAIDIVFPVIHGTFCEDGRMQGALELSDVCYVGAGVIGSAVGMDKDISKRLLKDADIPVVPWLTVRRVDWEESQDFIIEDVAIEFGFPCFVKPANAGSSVGISKVENRDEIKDKVLNAFNYDNKILIEKAINAREIEFSVLGNEHPKCSEPGEITTHRDFYSYEAKYIDKNGASLTIPADLELKLNDDMKQSALKAFQILSLKGMARIDFFLEKNSDNFYLNEVNTLPGFTSISMYPKLWDYSGLAYKDLLDSLIDLALQNFADRKRIRTTVPENIN